MAGLGRLRLGFAKEMLCSTDQSSRPLNYSSSLKLMSGEFIPLFPLMMEIPEMERPSLTTDCESDSSNLDSSAMKATLSSLSESEQY